MEKRKMMWTKVDGCRNGIFIKQKDVWRIYICYYQITKYDKGDGSESVVVQSIYKISITPISNNNE